MPKRKRPRVVHLVPALFGAQGMVGGGERYTYELARAMADRVGVTLVAFGDQPHRREDGKLEIVVLGKPWYVRGQRSNPLSLRLFPALRPATVVHCHQQHILASSLAALYCRLTRRQVFITDLGGGGWDVSAYLSTDRWYHGHLHISEYSERVSDHLDSPRSTVIWGGVDTAKFSPDPGVRRTGEALYVGRILPHKGINYLVEALPDDMRLEIIGQVSDPVYLADLRRLAAGKQVTFRHDVDDAELVMAYRRALCIVLPSVYRTIYGQETRVPELLGQTLLEGMACETPALATRVASLPEVVAHGTTGFVVPPNDAAALRERLIWLRDHPAEGLELGQRARARVLRRFTWPAVVERCLVAYGIEPEE
jgi:glycosyltransferase involved in cell wall biosynthesis